MAQFLAEWRRSTVGAEALVRFVRRLESCGVALDPPPSPARVTMALSVAPEGAVYVIFEADNAEVVLRACSDAGILPQRLTPNVHARVMETQSTVSRGRQSAES